MFKVYEISATIHYSSFDTTEGKYNNLILNKEKITDDFIKDWENRIILRSKYTFCEIEKISNVKITEINVLEDTDLL